MFERFRKKYGVCEFLGKDSKVKTRIFSQKVGRKARVVAVGLNNEEAMAIAYKNQEQNREIFEYRGVSPITGENIFVYIKFPM